MEYQKIKFQNKDKSAFFSVLRTRVDEYFKENELSRSGGNLLIVKAFFMLSLYFVPYFLILFGTYTSWQLFAFAILMGVGVAGVGMSVMHDAIHGSFSDNKLVNKFFGASIYFLGGNALNWEVQHNKLHHTFTNILEIDEDITGKFMLRLSFQDKLKSYHRFQHIYAFFLYSLMTISFLWKDFKEVYLYKKMSKVGIVKAFTKSELAELIITKIAYFVFILVIPLYFTDLTFGQWFAGFMIIHCTAGLILSTIFQLAHVVEGALQPAPDAKGNLESAWAIHQLQTTSNFAGKNKLLSWYIGGLDFQIEHHLFPNVSHVHYRKLSPIVEKTAHEFGVEYNAKHSFTNALFSHINMLKNMGYNQQYC